MSQQYPQQPHAQGPVPPQFQPPKPKNTTKTALIIVGSIFGGLVLLGILASLAPDAPEDTDADDKPVAQTTTTAPKPAAAPSSKPKPVEAPKSTPPAKPAAPKLACEDQDDRSKPCEIKVGSAFKLGSHTVLAGWKIKDNGYGTGMTIIGKAKNTDDKTSTMFVHIKFLKGDEVLANVMCNTGDLEPGQSEAMNCIPDGTYTKKFDKVTAESTF